MSPLSDKRKTSSPDYPSLARKLLESSEEITPSKLPAGLYIVATPIGHLGDISLRALWNLASVNAITCEDTRFSGGMLSKYGIKSPLIPYHDHNADTQRPLILKRISDGEAIALISDAGMPLIADPGFKLVRACREAGHPVIVIPGANAAVTALAGSGLPTDRFLFIGFLPPKTVARRKVIAKLASVPVTLIFYEAPQRIAATLADFAELFGGHRPATVARELTKLFEETRCGTLDELATFYANNDAKGEITLVISGADDAEAPVYDIDALLTKHMKSLSMRDAVAAVSAITSTKKSEVYARALAQQTKRYPK